MFVENLELRRLLSAAVAVSGSGVLTVNGNSADDQIAVTENNGAVTVAYTDKNGVFHDASGSLGTTDGTSFSGITAIRINGGGGDDQIFYTGNSIGADIHGDNQQSGAPRDNGGRCSSASFREDFYRRFGRHGRGGSGGSRGGS